MSRWRPDPWCLVVGEQSAVLARRGPRVQPSCLMGVEGPWNRTVEPLIADAAAAGHKPAQLEVIVAGPLAQHWSCQAPQGTASLRELRAYASARRQQQFGDTPAAEWWVEADWRAAGGFACMAVPQALVILIDGIARSLRLRWTISTDMAVLMAAAALQKPLRHGRWVAVETPQGGLLWHVQAHHGLRFMRGWRQGAQGEPLRREGTVPAEWRRAQLRADESATGPLTWLTADEQGMTVTSLAEDGGQTVSPSVRAWPLVPGVQSTSWLGALALHGGGL